jgi:hypothetical protein
MTDDNSRTRHDRAGHDRTGQAWAVAMTGSDGRVTEDKNDKVVENEGTET